MCQPIIPPSTVENIAINFNIKGITKRLKKSKKNQLNTLPETTAPVTRKVIGKIKR